MTDKTGPVQGFWDAVKSWWGRVWWVFPLAMFLLSQAVPDLRGSVTGGATSPNLPWWLLAELVLGLGWLVGGLFHITSGNTSVSALKFDAAVSNVLQLALVVLATYQTTMGMLQWGLIIPTLVTVADVFLTGDRAINNAAQKPIVQQQNVKA